MLDKTASETLQHNISSSTSLQWRSEPFVLLKYDETEWKTIFSCILREYDYKASLETVYQFTSPLWNTVFLLITTNCCSVSTSGVNGFSQLLRNFSFVAIMLSTRSGECSVLYSHKRTFNWLIHIPFSPNLFGFRQMGKRFHFLQ